MPNARDSTGRSGTSVGTQTAPGSGTLAGTTQEGTGAYGTVPTVPDPLTTATKDIAGNLANLGNIGNLATVYNQLTNAGALASLTSNLPGYGNMVDTSTGNILSHLEGQIPQDVQALLSQYGAEHGISMGAPGAPANDAALMKALYQTSTGLQQQGETELTAAINRTPVGKQFDPGSMFVTPEQSQSAQYMANLLASSPNPGQAGAAGQGAGLAGLLAGMKAGGGGAPAIAGAGGGGTMAPGRGTTTTSSTTAYPNLPVYGTGLPYTNQSNTDVLSGMNLGGPTRPGTTDQYGFTPDDYAALGLTPEDFNVGAPSQETGSPSYPGADVWDYQGGDYYGDGG